MKRRTVAWMAAAWSITGTLHGQEGPHAPPAAVESKFDAGVETYIDESFEVGESLHQLGKLEGAGRWVEASLLADRLLSTEGDRPVRVGAWRYERLGALLNRRISNWPNPGLSAYRELFDKTAATERTEARNRRDPEASIQVMNRYWYTSASIPAAEDYYEISLERGEFGRAQWVCREMISKHPEKEAASRVFRPRLAIAAAMSGEESAAHGALSEIGFDTVSMTMRWMGRSEAVETLVPQLLSEATGNPDPTSDGAWPTFGGNYGRNRIGSCPLDDMALLWRFEPSRSGLALWRPAQSPAAPAAVEELERQLVVHPVAGDDLVYIQTEEGVWGLNRQSGAPAWHASLGLGGAGAPRTDGSAAAWMSPTLDRERLYVCVGGDPSPHYVGEEQEATGGVYCLDARSGVVLWRLQGPSANDEFVRMIFDPSPVVTGDYVYAVGRRRRTFGFEDCYLYQLRASDGWTIRRTHLGSGSTGGFGYERPAFSILSRCGDSLYVGTQLGSVAAVCAHSGLLEWLFTYERESESDWHKAVRATGRQVLPWHYNPVYCEGERLVHLPIDRRALYVLNRSDGSLLNRIEAAEAANAKTLLGIENGRLFGLGDAVFAFDLGAGRMIWTAALKDGEKVHGRGMLVEGGVVLPTRDGLVRFDASDGRRSSIDWNSDGGTGNLVPLPDQLVIAGPHSVSAYGRKTDLWQRLKALMAARPDDPAPALDLAEAAFRSRDLVEAIEALAKAVERAGNVSLPEDAEIRRRLYRDSLWFAQGGADPAPDPGWVGRMYGWAERFAPDAASHVECRMRHAAFLVEQDAAAQAVKLYQEIIHDRTLRECRFTTTQEDNLAGRIAEDRIASLITQRGRTVYAPFDDEAREWLEAARNSDDAELLDRILVTRPLADSVADALRLKGDILRRRGSPEQAARAYTESMLADPARFRSAETMRLIADCHVESGDVASAWRRLTQASIEFPGATVDMEGRAVDFAMYRDLRVGVGAAFDTRRSNVRPPLVMRYDVYFSDSMVVLQPVLPVFPGGDESLVPAYTENRLVAVRADSGATAWEVVAFPTCPQWLLTTRDSLILSSPYEVVALNVANGSVRWAYGERPAGLDDPSTDPERFPTFHSHAWHGDRLYTLRSDGRASCIRLGDGIVEWERFLEHRIAGPFAVNGRNLVYPGRSSTSHAYCVLDADTGRLEQTLERTDALALLRLHLTWDGRLIAMGSRSVDAFDVGTSQWLWHLRQAEAIVDATAVVDSDGIYLNVGDSRMQKIRLHDGRVEWRTSPLFRVEPQSVRTDAISGGLVVVTEQGVNVIRDRDGRSVWESGPFVEGAMDAVLFESSGVVIVSSSEVEGRREQAAYFVDCDPRSKDGENAVTRAGLGDLGEVRGALLGRDTLIVYTSRRISGWQGAGPDAGGTSKRGSP